MSLGDLTNNVQNGGAGSPPNSSLQARVIIALGVCVAGVVNQLYQLASSAGILGNLDTGPLADYVNKLLDHGAASVYAVPVNPSSAGALSAAVAQTGTGLATITPSCAPHRAIKILCMLGGVIGTMKVQFSFDGGVTYGPLTTSADSGSGTWIYMVPGTFCTLTFAAATYVATKTCTIGVDGTVTNGSAWVGVVTQVSSPIDNYNVQCQPAIGGVLGTAVLQVSLDGGLTPLPNMPVPSGGIIVIPNTGIVLTCANNGGSFNAGDVYSFLAIPPGFSTGDITAAIAAVRSLPTCPTVALCHVIGLPSSAAGAISLASIVDGACVTLATPQYQKNWIGLVECPSKAAGDAVVSGGNAIVDTADTDTVIRAARMGVDLRRTSVWVATQQQQNVVNGWKIRRPVGWGLAARYVEADPSSDPCCKGTGALDFYLVGGALNRDEFSAGVTLYDAQFNTLRTYPNSSGAFISIESGGVGWRNMTTAQGWQDANFIRVLNLFLAAITFAGQKYLGSRQPTKADGTIQAGIASVITSDLKGTAESCVGLDQGGAFTEPQASAASALVLGTSQLRDAPKTLVVSYRLDALNLVSNISDNISIH